MTTQTIPPESLSTGDWQQIFIDLPEEGDIRPQEYGTSKEIPQSFDKYDSEEIRQIVSRIGIDVFMTDSDERLDYLQTVNPALTEEHLNEIATTTERWLNDEARERIRAIARRAFDRKSGPRDMVTDWATSEEIERLVGFLMEASIPDKTLAVCYAMATAYDTAEAAFLVHGNRVERRIDFGDLAPTADETAGDLRFANSN